MADWLKYADEVEIGGRPVSFWAEKYGLPLHLYSAAVIRRNLRAFKNVLAKRYPKARVCFAAKACTHPLVLKIVNEEGCGADVASYNEVRGALEGGLPPGMLDLNGNCKEDFLIKDAIKQGMNIIADSFEEFERVAQLAAKLGGRPKVLLRVSGYQLEHVTDDSVFTAGVWTKFGADISLVPAFLKELGKYPSVELVGFHTHLGSQVAQLAPYQVVLKKLIELGRLLQKNGGRLEVINIGGGFPVEYVDKKTWGTIVKRIKRGYLAARKGDWSKVFVWHDGLAGFAAEGNERVHLNRWTGERFYTPYPKEKMLAALLTDKMVAALKVVGEPTLTIEPGRSVVEDAGVTLARVGIVKKVARDHDLVNLEMGIVCHGESLIEKPVKRWEIVSGWRRKDKKPFEAFIGGNLCFSGDMISKYKVFLQRKPARGEIVMVHNTGAYTSSLFAANSNSFPRPSRVLVEEDGGLKFLKKRDEYQEIICQE